MADLPDDDPERLAAARPWRQRAWERVPKWSRIALKSLTLLLVIHLILGIRIWYGLQDPPEVANMRRPGSEVWYHDQMMMGTEIQRLMQTVLIGLRGRTADDVVRIIPGYQTSDEDLQYVAQHFPNLRMIHLVQTPISSKGLLALKDCHELYHIDATDTRVDDGLAELLPSLPKLELLWVAWTDVGDKFAAAAAKLRVYRELLFEGHASAQKRWPHGDWNNQSA